MDNTHDEKEYAEMMDMGANKWLHPDGGTGSNDEEERT